MVRKMCGAAMLALASAFVLTSCGDKVPEELTKKWDERESQVMAQLTEVRNKYEEVKTKCEAIPKDSTRAGELTAIENTLRGTETEIGDIEKTLNNLKSQRDSVAAGGNSADFQALWEKAQGTYDDVSNRLTGIMASLGPINDKVQNLATGAPLPAADSATAAAARTADTNTASGSSATGSTATGTNGQATTSSPRGSSTTSGSTTSSGTTSKPRGTSSSSGDEPLLKANENPSGTPEGSTPAKVDVKPNKNP